MAQTLLIDRNMNTKRRPATGIAAESRRTLKQTGSVSLLRLERLGVVVYGIEYPAKFHGREMSQFLNLIEADLEFYRYAKFFANSLTTDSEKV